MPKHTVYLVTYSRGLHPLTGGVRPHHWAYFLETDPRHTPEPSGVVFQLRGTPGGFYFPGAERDMPVSQDGAPGELRDRLEVGEVDGDGIEGLVGRMEGVLRGVEVVKDEGRAWNCQDWALGGLEGLKGQGVVYEWLEGEGVRKWLSIEVLEILPISRASSRKHRPFPSTDRHKMACTRLASPFDLLQTDLRK